MRRPFLLSTATLLFLWGKVCPAAGADFDVSIAIPHVDNQPRDLQWGADRGVHFHVVLTNTSNEPQRAFQEWCSWGYEALSFEATDEDGKTSKIRKPGGVWTMNYPAHWTIPPGESLVFEVYLPRWDVWGDQFGLKPGPTGKITLKATYQVNPDAESTKQHVWTGTIASQPVECIIR